MTRSLQPPSRTLVFFTKRFLHLSRHTRGEDPEVTAIERSEIEFPRTIEASLMQANRTSHFVIYAGHSVVESAASILDFFQSVEERFAAVYTRIMEPKLAI